jgi:hypothetical protein
MLVTRCDICKKDIKDHVHGINVGVRGSFSTFACCEKCGKPVKTFLQKHKLIEKERDRNQIKK